MPILFAASTRVTPALNRADPTLVQREIIMSIGHRHLRRISFLTQGLDFADLCAECRSLSRSQSRPITRSTAWPHTIGRIPIIDGRRKISAREERRARSWKVGAALI